MPPPEPGRSGEPQQPPSPSGGKTGFGSALLAALVWAGVNLILTIAIIGPPPSAEAAGAYTFGLLVPVLLAALITWAIARRRDWAFWQLVLLALPFYLIIRVLLGGATAAGA
ncbi:MAG: hypothetical protein GEV09_04390 [Pseudonocardiaceae bacterium]|nr:hypothetical protein [Pseudonocardiaceae bacterium]